MWTGGSSYPSLSAIPDPTQQGYRPHNSDTDQPAAIFRSPCTNSNTGYSHAASQSKYNPPPSPASSSRTGTPLLHNVHTADEMSDSNMTDRGVESMDSFWDEADLPMQDSLADDVQQTGLLRTPYRSLSRWLANSNTPLPK